MRDSAARPARGDIEALLDGYTGTIEQVPPQFSAVKIAGNRAYDLARGGEAVEIAPREVEIHRLDLVACPDADHAVFVVECGKGTYVRSLARDFGRDLGCFGHISSLRRIGVAPFSDADMVPLATLTGLEGIEDDGERLAALDAYLIDTGEALANLPHVAITDDQAHRLRLGNPIILRGRDAPLDEPDVWVTARGRLVAIGEIGQGEFRPRRVFGN